MENFISGLANSLNFDVNGKFITWNGYSIPAHNISLFAVGVSSTYPKEPQEFLEGAFVGFMSVMCILDQIVNEDNENLTDTLNGFYNLCIEEDGLPCINLLLNDGTVLEITFKDLWSFRESLKKIREVCSHYVGICNVVINGNSVQLGQITTGSAQVNEYNLHLPEITSGEEEQ